MRAVDMAMMNNQAAVVTLLLERGSKGAPGVLQQAIQRGNVALVTVALASPELTLAHLRPALAGAKKVNNPEIVALIEKKLAAMPVEPAAPAVSVDRATLQSYVGSYRNEEAGAAITVVLNGEQLMATPPGGTAPALTLIAISPTSFRVAEREGLTISFEGRGGLIERAVATIGNTPQVWTRVATPPAGAPAPPAATATPPPAAPAATPADLKPAARTAARNWPGFRGENAAGNGDGQGAVVEWDVDTQQNIRWKTAIPGISNASPVVWGNRVFVVTAVSSAGDKTFRTGLYGDVAPVNDLSEHTWKIYCLDKATGKIVWERDAFKGAPKVKRHTKASQANSTPVTDGRRVVAIFGSIGILAAWDMEGKPLWTDRRRDHRQRLVLRTRHAVGTLELADHPWRERDRAGRSPEGLVHRGLPRGERKAAVAHRARRDLDLGNADGVPRRQPRTDRHQRPEDPRLRPRDRQAPVDARPEL